jgi:Flp pilus assembly pilin Flp
MSFLKSFLTDDRGTESVEWAIMAGLFTTAVILAVSFVASWVEGRFTGMEDAIRQGEGGGTG